MKKIILSFCFISILLITSGCNYLIDTFFYNSAVSKIEKKDYESALKDLNNALKLNKNYADAYLKRSIIFDKTGRIQDAISDVSKAIEIEPDNPQLYISRCAYYIKINDLQNAYSDAKQSLNIEPTNPKANLAMGIVEYNLDMYDDSIKYLNEVQKQVLDTPIVLFYLGKNAMKKGDVIKATELFTKTLELNPKYEDVYKDLALIKAAQNQYPAAMALLDKGLSINSENYDLYITRAKIKILNNENDSAMDDLTRALEIRSDDYLAYFYMASAQINSNLLERAMKNLEFAKSICTQKNDIRCLDDIKILETKVFK